MSKTKRKIQNEQSALTGSNETNHSDKQLQKSGKSGEPTASEEVKTAVFKSSLSYLKTHALMTVIVFFLAFGALGAGLKYLDEAAEKEIARRDADKSRLKKREESFLHKINPFLPAALPDPTPQLAKEYIYAGSRMLAVEDAGASPVPPADLAVWRPTSGVWWIMGGTGSQQFSQGWGLRDDLPAPGDYDGDGRTDLCIFRPSTNIWWIVRSSDGGNYSVAFGANGDSPAQADYDGDGKTDIAVFRPSTGSWYINQSSDSVTVQGQFGLSTDEPTPKDFDGDGRADLAVWRSSNSTFYSQKSSDNQLQTATFNESSTNPVPADYDGDGKADYAIRSGADWVIRFSSNQRIQSINWQQATDLEVPNDYDGDGKVDIAVWRNANGNWFIRKSGSGGALRQEIWGQRDDIPVPAFYRR